MTTVQKLKSNLDTFTKRWWNAKFETTFRSPTFPDLRFNFLHFWITLYIYDFIALPWWGNAHFQTAQTISLIKYEAKTEKGLLQEGFHNFSVIYHTSDNYYTSIIFQWETLLSKHFGIRSDRLALKDKFDTSSKKKSCYQ